MLSALIRSRLRYPAVHLAVQPVNQRSVQHGPLVLVSEPRKFPAPTIDRDRTVSRRTEPSSRATLMGEQPNPWDLLQPQDVTSRHRGAKPLRRDELFGGISLLSPEYLLSFERCPFHAETPNPWDLLQPQDVTSRHRGAKPLRRYELLGGISLLSPEYLLSFERCPFHAETPDHYALVSYLIDLSVSQSSTLLPLHSKAGYQSA